MNITGLFTVFYTVDKASNKVLKKQALERDIGGEW